MSKITSLFGIKQRIANSPQEVRDLVHREFYKLFQRNNGNIESDTHYKSSLDEVFERNAGLQKKFEETPAFTLGTSIIFFLAELEEGKTIFVPPKGKRKSFLRRYTKSHLFDETRGKPIEIFIQMIKKVVTQVDLSEHSHLVANLLFLNAQYGDGTMERLYLNLLHYVGKKSDIALIRKYRRKVEKGIFGYQEFKVVGKVAYRVNKKEQQQKMIERVDSIIRKLSGEKAIK